MCVLIKAGAKNLAYIIHPKWIIPIYVFVSDISDSIFSLIVFPFVWSVHFAC